MSIATYLKNEDTGKEKHVPDIKIKDCLTSGEIAVTIQVSGKVLHPSTPEHAIKTISLYGLTKENKLDQLTIFHLGDENTQPCMRTSIKKNKYQKLICTSYCNLHGLWENEINLS